MLLVRKVKSDTTSLVVLASKDICLAMPQARCLFSLTQKRFKGIQALPF
jgi:hypothetical protein